MNMKITIEFNRDFKSQEDIVAFMNALTPVKGEEVTLKTEAPIEESPKVAAIEKAKKKTEPEVEEIEEAEIEEVVYTMDDAKSLASRLLKTYRAEVTEIIKGFGVKKLTDLTDPEDIHSAVLQFKELEVN